MVSWLWATALTGTKITGLSKTGIWYAWPSLSWFLLCLLLFTTAGERAGDKMATLWWPVTRTTTVELPHLPASLLFKTFHLNTWNHENYSCSNHSGRCLPIMCLLSFIILWACAVTSLLCVHARSAVGSLHPLPTARIRAVKCHALVGCVDRRLLQALSSILLSDHEGDPCPTGYFGSSFGQLSVRWRMGALEEGRFQAMI